MSGKLHYRHLVQKPSFCAPASVQMILFRRDIWVDQMEIARHLEIKIPESEKEAFHLPVPIGREQGEFGILLKDFRSERISNLFTAHNISLHASVYFLRNIENVAHFIAENLQQGNDVMVNFWMTHEKKHVSMAHYSVIAEIRGDIVTICDPLPENKPFWQISVEALANAMTQSFDGRERGFVVFSEKNV